MQERGQRQNHTEAADDGAIDENYEVIMQEQPQDEEYDWWDDYKEEEYSPQEWADHYQSVYETKADSVQREANVIKKHLGGLKKKTFKSSLHKILVEP